MVIIFPPYPVMAVFNDIRNASRESENVLGGLATQIGDNMQQSLDSFSKEMLNGLAGSTTEASN